MNIMTKEAALDLIIRDTFSIDVNANDFFQYACAGSVTISTDDLKWILPMVQKYGGVGLSACIAYIFNMKPIGAHISEQFILAIDELQTLNPKVQSDEDNTYYSTSGEYRTIDIRYVDMDYREGGKYFKKQ